MEVEALALDNPDKAKQVIDSVSGLIVNADRVTRVREVFRSELELGLKYGLEKVCYSLNMPLYLNIAVKCANGNNLCNRTSSRR